MIEHGSGPAMPGGSTTWHAATEKGTTSVRSSEQGLCRVSFNRMLPARQDRTEFVRGVHDLAAAVDLSSFGIHAKSRLLLVRFPTPCSLALSKRSSQHVAFNGSRFCGILQRSELHGLNAVGTLEVCHP